MEKKEYVDALLRSALFLKDTSEDGGQIISLLNPSEFNPNPGPSSDLELNIMNLRLISLLINKDSYIHEIFWNSYAEAWVDYADSYMPFNTSEIIEILQKFGEGKRFAKSAEEKKNHNDLFDKLVSFFGVNGFLKKSSNNNIQSLREFEPGASAVLNHEHFRNSLIEDAHQTLLHSFLVIQGLSPLKGHGRENDIDKSSIPSKTELNFLSRNYLIHEVQNPEGYVLNSHLDYYDFSSLQESFGKKQALLEIHTEQLDVLIGKLKKLLNQLEKMQKPASEDRTLKQVFTLGEYLEFNFNSLARKSQPGGTFLNSIYEGNKITFKDSEMFDQGPKEKYDLDLQLELMFETAKTDLDIIFITSIEYLLNALRARRDVCQYLVLKRSLEDQYALDHDISYKRLSILAEFSTLRTIKNEITRKKSGLIKKTEREANWFIKAEERQEKRSSIEMQSAFEWLSDPKRDVSWKEVVMPSILEKSINYDELMNLEKNFQDLIESTESFSKTEKSAIRSALDLNKKRGSKIAKTLLEKFYEQQNQL